MDAEGSRTIQERTIARLQDPSTEATDILSDFATPHTQIRGCGHGAGPRRPQPAGPRARWGVGRAVTEHNQLCLGDMERMVTDSRGLLLIIGTGRRRGRDEGSRPRVRGDDIDHYIIHQVSTVHCDALVQRLGLTRARCR